MSESDRIRVLLLTDNLRNGGVQTVVVLLANELSKRGAYVVVAASSEGDLWNRLDEGVHRERLAANFPNGVGVHQRIHKIRNLIRRHDIGVVHAHQRGVALISRVATFFLKTRVVEHVHNVFLPARNRLLSFRGHALIACGSEIERMLLHDYGRSANRVHRVPNGVPDLRSLNMGCEGAGDASPRLLTVARVSSQKRPMLWLETMEELSKIRPITATWLGGGELLEAMRDEVQRRGLERVISFAGHAPEPQIEMSRSDLVVLTSAWEGLPLALLEAASLGRPLVATDVGSCKDIVEDQVNGRLVKAETPAKEIAKIINEVLDPRQLALYGQRSRARYESEFSLNRFVAGVERVYASV